MIHNKGLSQDWSCFSEIAQILSFASPIAHDLLHPKHLRSHRLDKSRPFSQPTGFNRIHGVARFRSPITPELFVSNKIISGQSFDS